MGYELRDHTADVAVEATGASLGDAFAAVADGLAAACCEDVPATGGDRFDVAVTAADRESALFDYLDELIFQRDVRAVLPVENEASVSEGADGVRVEGSARGVPLAAIRGREVKAVTYSEMVVERSGDGWHVYVVFDV